MTDIIVSDFDETLFRRYVGLLPMVAELERAGYPVYILTYRAESQLEFIQQTLAPTGLNVIGYAFAGSRKKDPATKMQLLAQIRKKYNVVRLVDDDPRVVLH